MKTHLPIARSDIHVHLTKEHIERLFGKGYELTKWYDLTIPGQFACKETVTVMGELGSIEGVVVVGPAREYTQVEISLTNGLTLGIDPPLRDSGDIERSPGAVLYGTAGKVVLSKGVIAARRHIHMHTSDAEKYGVVDKEYVSVKVDGPRGLVYNNVLVRVNKDYALEMHLDVDEGNAAGLKNYDILEIL